MAFGSWPIFRKKTSEAKYSPQGPVHSSEYSFQTKLLVSVNLSVCFLDIFSAVGNLGLPGKSVGGWDVGQVVREFWGCPPLTVWQRATGRHLVGSHSNLCLATKVSRRAGGLRGDLSRLLKCSLSWRDALVVTALIRHAEDLGSGPSTDMVAHNCQ